MYKLYCSSDNWKKLNKSRIFEEMYDGDYYTGECKIKFEFFGKLITINLQVMAEEEPTEYQRETLDKFMRIFPSIQEKIIKRKEQKNTYGPDDRDEMEKMWPDINSVDEMLKHLEFNSIIKNKKQEVNQIGIKERERYMAIQGCIIQYITLRKMKVLCK